MSKEGKDVNRVKLRKTFGKQKKENGFYKHRGNNKHQNFRYTEKDQQLGKYIPLVKICQTKRRKEKEYVYKKGTKPL